MKKPLEIAFSLLSRKSYHSLELTQKLKEKGVEKEAISPVLQSLRESGYLDDEAWEIRFIEGFARKGKGAHLLAPTLHPKGLLPLLPRLKTLLQSHEKSSLEALIYKHRKLEKRLLIQRLQRRGFNLEAILETVKQSENVLLLNSEDEWL